MESGKYDIFIGSGDVPYKTILNENLYNSLTKQKKILPIHLQISITNKCNLNCKFCSCSDRRQTNELSLDEIKYILTTMKSLKTKVISIIGGGEPLCHPYFNEILEYCLELNLRVGLVTNGILLNKIDRKVKSAITWCRISYSDDKTNNYWDGLQETLNFFTKNYDNIDFSFSYILLDEPNEDNQKLIVDYANKNNFVNVRFSCDLYNQNVYNLRQCKSILENADINIDRCSFVYKDYVNNPKTKCLVPFLKPVIGADGYVYPCCGIQYIDKHDFSNNFRICHYKEIGEWLKNNTPFDNENCSICFYDLTNKYLNIATKTINHLEWV